MAVGLEVLNSEFLYAAEDPASYIVPGQEADDFLSRAREVKVVGSGFVAPETRILCWDPVYLEPREHIPPLRIPRWRERVEDTLTGG